MFLQAPLRELAGKQGEGADKAAVEAQTHGDGGCDAGYNMGRAAAWHKAGTRKLIDEANVLQQNAVRVTKNTLLSFPTVLRFCLSDIKDLGMPTHKQAMDLNVCLNGQSLLASGRIPPPCSCFCPERTWH